MGFGRWWMDDEDGNGSFRWIVDPCEGEVEG